MPYTGVRNLKLANSVTSEKFAISFLIVTDHYWSFVKDYIIRGKGPTAQQSSLGTCCLLTTMSEATSSALFQITSLINDELNEPDI